MFPSIASAIDAFAVINAAASTAFILPSPQETPFEKLRLLGIGNLTAPIYRFIFEVLLSPVRLRVEFLPSLEKI